MVRFIKREKKKKQKKCRGQQTDSISLFFFTKDGMCCQTVKTYTSRIVIGPPREVLHRFHVCGVCVQARVFCEWARCECVCVCVCFDICVCTCRSVCVLHKCVYASLCAYIRSVCSFSTHLSTLIRFTEVLWGTSVAPINGKYTRAGRKKTCYTPWSTMTASLPREAPLQSSLGL